MIVSILGAHGQIARLMTPRLTAQGHTVRGLVRSETQFEDIRSDGAEPVLLDLEESTSAEFDAALTGSDVVVFAAGAGPGSGADRKNTLDRDGAIKGVEAAVRVRAGRYVVVSSMGADDPPTDDETFSVYLRAKRDADEAVRAAGIAYTIVRPGRLTDGDPTGAVQLGDRVERGEITRTDVAHVLSSVIVNPGLPSSTFEVVDGATPIGTAVADLMA